VLDAGVSMIATISRQEQETLKLRPGDSVSIHVPDEALHVLDDR
jgi:protein involved in polysaccharide export with SLBB domain